jgi:acetylornithine deacetylase/succinyl-diaminopimelate desuccinylase-like protein
MRTHALMICAAAVALSAVPLAAQTSPANTPAVRAARSYRAAHEHDILAEFVKLLAIPNVARDTANIGRNVRQLVAMLERRGLNPRILPPGPDGGSPAVYAERMVPGAKRTLVIYAHYDGQPANPKSWEGGAPWTPVLRSAPLEDGGTVIPFPGPGEHADTSARLYARSAGDDKAGVMAVITATDALRAAGLTPSANIKLFFEGEEEAGSPHLGEMLARNATLLASDLWIIVDGPVHQSGAKQVVFGVRGDMNVDLTMYGPNRPLHSGHYGNWAPNPAMRLAHLLASMTDDSGHVTIAGWYDGVDPLTAADSEALARLPRYDEQLAHDLGIARPDGGGRSLAELLLEPSLNVNGFASADVGQFARNVIPTTATAVLDLRLVRGNTPEGQFAKLVAHVKRQGYLVLDRAPTDAERVAHDRIATLTMRGDGYAAARTPLDSPIARDVAAAVASTTTTAPVLQPTTGGSLPLSVLSERLHVPFVIVPIANYDDNQHAENENLKLANFWSGIETLAAVMAMP